MLSVNELFVCTYELAVPYGPEYMFVSVPATASRYPRIFIAFGSIDNTVLNGTSTFAPNPLSEPPGCVSPPLANVITCVGRRMAQ